MKRLLSGLAMCALLALAGTAIGKTMGTVSYAVDRVFPAAVRFLRIDERLEIVEKDADAGYILFELAEEGKTFRGTFEVAAVKDERGRDAARLIVRIEDRPAYMEQGLITRFEQKLRSELGDPPEPPAPPPAADDDEDGGKETRKGKPRQPPDNNPQPGPPPQ